MPKIPGLDQALIARAQAGVDAMAKNPPKRKEPSLVQKTAATRVARLYHQSMDWVPDKRYRENMLGPMSTKGPITWENRQLNEALALASNVAQANGKPHDEVMIAKLEGWKKALK